MPSSADGVTGRVSPSPRAAELVTPRATLCASYRTLVAEFVDHGEKLVPFVLGFEHGDCDAMLARLVACSRGLGLPDGFIAHSTYWLVEHRTNVVGVCNIRHTLTPALLREGGHIGYGIRPSARARGLGTEILRQSLRRARDLGIADVLVTCGQSNVASARAIIRNGGVLDSEVFLPDRGEVVQRYWIRAALHPP